MLCGETVAVCCENRTEHTDTLWAVHTSQETQHISATETNRLMLCGKIVAVYCENSTEHTDALLGVRTSQGTHYISTTEPNRLMLCGESVAVCCENRTEHRYTVGSLYLTAVKTSNLTQHWPGGLRSGEVMSPMRYELSVYIPENILHSHRRGNLKSYIVLAG
jgi:hypothetical protein